MFLYLKDYFRSWCFQSGNTMLCYAQSWHRIFFC